MTVSSALMRLSWSATSLSSSVRRVELLTFSRVVMRFDSEVSAVARVDASAVTEFCTPVMAAALVDASEAMLP